MLSCNGLNASEMNGRRGRGAVGALMCASLFGALGCSAADMTDEEFEKQESALIQAADDPPRVTTAPTFVIESVRPEPVKCPFDRYYAIMQVEPELGLSSAQPVGTHTMHLQATPQSVIVAVATCPVVEDYDASALVNGVCTYDALVDGADAPVVPGALAVAKCDTTHYKGGDTPEEKSPAINNYYSDLDVLLVVFRTSELKVQLVRPGQSTITIASETTALTPYTRTLSSLPNDSRIRADYVDDPSGWVIDNVHVQ